MICSECEQLFDAYLDGQLAGSLRLEFDAHRLRCRQCQQELALLEAVGHAISSDSLTPELSAGFTDGVMQQLTQPAPQIVRWPWPRVAVVVGALAQIAAVLVFALVWFSGPHSGSRPPIVLEPPGNGGPNQPVFAYPFGRVSELWRGAQSEVSEWKAVLNRPDAAAGATVAEASSEQSPLGALLIDLFGVGNPRPPEPQPAVAEDNVHSI